MLWSGTHIAQRQKLEIQDIMPESPEATLDPPISGQPIERAMTKSKVFDDECRV